MLYDHHHLEAVFFGGHIHIYKDPLDVWDYIRWYETRCIPRPLCKPGKCECNQLLVEHVWNFIFRDCRLLFCASYYICLRIYLFICLSLVECSRPWKRASHHLLMQLRDVDKQVVYSGRARLRNQVSYTHSHCSVALVTRCGFLIN